MTPARESADLPKLEQYELREEIGHGGMATVYRAKDPRLGREVAVKIIHRHLRDNAEVATRFVAEARAAAKLKHKGIVEVYDVSRDEDRERYLVAELIRGATLRKVLGDHPEMPAEIGAAITIELCDAVEHAHDAGIIHRDIKPENVLVELPQDRDRAPRSEAVTPVVAAPSNDNHEERDGDVVDEQASSAPRAVDLRSSDDRPSEVSSERPSGRSKEPPRSDRKGGVLIKLTDFGIAKIIDAHGITSTGQVLGSPAHMAPEQIEGGEIDARTDVFALGVLAYECMVGHLPFEGKNPAQVLRRVIEGNFAPAETERPSVGARFGQILAHALATAPADRTATPSELAAQLRSELADLGITSPHDEVCAYFADPEAYKAELGKRIVPKLIARGEAARRARKVPLAAADFNRAHALSPNDAAILKRIMSLASARGRARFAKRLGVIVGSAVALGALAFGIVKLTRKEVARLTPDPAPTFAHDDTPRTPAVMDDQPTNTTNVPVATAVPSHPIRTLAIVRSGVLPDPTTTAATSGPPRSVKFNQQPPGALLTVDGTPVGFGEAKVLTPGPHSYSLTPPPNDTCCDAVSSTFDVPAAPKDKPDEVKTISPSLTFRPGTVMLIGAPADGQANCSFGPLTAGAPKEVRFREAVTQVTCQFSSGDTKKSGVFPIKAGSKTDIVWPR